MVQTKIKIAKNAWKENRLPTINELDSNIIKRLLVDGRATYDKIAQECGVSKNKVWKRCRSLERKGIINGATTQINFGQFGFDALATLLINVEAHQLEKAMEFIQNITEVNAYRQYNSIYNVRAIASLKGLNELDYVKQVIKRRLPITSLKTYIWTSIRNIPENLDLSGNCSKQDTNENFGDAISPQTGVTVNDIDRQIAQKLKLNGREPFTNIAKEMGLSTDTVVKKYRKLREIGALKVSVQINPNRIGYSSILDFNVAFTAPGGLSNTVVESLAKIPDVIMIIKTSGDYDLQVTAMIRDIPQLFALQDEISRINGITRIEVSARKIPESWPTPQQYISTF